MTFEIPQLLCTIVYSLELEDDKISVTDFDNSKDIILPTIDQNTQKNQATIDILLFTPETIPDPTWEILSETISKALLASISFTLSDTHQELPRKSPVYNVSASFDMENILLERMKRSRKKKYTAAVQSTFNVQQPNLFVRQRDHWHSDLLWGPKSLEISKFKLLYSIYRLSLWCSHHKYLHLHFLNGNNLNFPFPVKNIESL